MRASSAVGALAVAVCATVLASCGSDADPVEEVVAPAVTLAAEGIEAIDEADALTCDADRRTLEQAVEAFTLLEGRPPATEAELVPDFVREESERFDVVDGAVVATAGGACS